MYKAQAFVTTNLCLMGERVLKPCARLAGLYAHGNSESVMLIALTWTAL
jgi:hypothetical protein